MRCLLVFLFLAGCPSDLNIGAAANSEPTASITTPTLEETLYEGVATSLVGRAGDNDLGDTLTATWMVNGETVCEEAATDDEGMTRCEFVPSGTEAAITLTVYDAAHMSATDTRTMQVVADTPPTLDIQAPTADGRYYADALVPLDATVSDAETAPEALRVHWSSNVAGDLGTQLADANGRVVTGASLAKGEHLITATVTDGLDQQTSASVVVVVNGENHAPTCTIHNNDSAGAPSESVTFTGTVEDAELPNPQLTVRWSSDLNGDLATPTPATNGAVSFTTTSLDVGTHVITLSAEDDAGLACSGTVLYTVGTPPEATLTAPTDTEADEGETVAFAADVSDAQDASHNLTVAWTSDRDGLISDAAAGSDGVTAFSTSTLSRGNHTVTLTVTDKDGMSVSRAVSLSVNGVPVGTDGSVQTDEDTSVDVVLAATDPDGDALNYTVVEDPVHGVLSGNPPNLTYTPASNYAGSDSFGWKAGDGRSQSAKATTAIVVNATNDAPTAADLSLTVGRGGTHPVLLTGSDPDGDPLTYAVVQAPAHGTLSGVAPSLTYQPHSDYLGTDAFTYTAHDGTVASDAVAVSVTVVGVQVSTTQLTLTEAGDAATFTVVLGAPPTGDVTLPASSSDLTEGTVSPAELTFTPNNWNAPQTVTITPADDSSTDGDVAWTTQLGPTTSADVAFHGVTVDAVTVTTQDDDHASLVLNSDPTALTEGSEVEWTVVLSAEPQKPVLITVESPDPRMSVTPTLVPFDEDDWYIPVTLTLSAPDDDVAEADAQVAVTLDTSGSPDAHFAALSPMSVDVDLTDDDTADILVSTGSLTVDEAGGQDSLTVTLTSQPTASVAIAVSADPRLTLSLELLTFDDTNWNQPQTLTVTGIDNATHDAVGTLELAFAAAASDDDFYAGLDAQDVVVTVVDDDIPGLYADPLTGLVTTDADGQDTFQVALTSEPHATVTVDVVASPDAEVTADLATLTFTVDDWADAQTVTLTGVSDQRVDGDADITVMLTTTSDDVDYAEVELTLTGTNLDPDVASLTTAVHDSLDEGGSIQWSMTPTSRPDSPVTVNLAADAGLTVSQPSLTWTDADWDTTKSVTVTSVNNDIDTLDQSLQVHAEVDAQSDPTYTGLDWSHGLLVLDDDAAGLSLSLSSDVVAEGGAAQTATVTLHSEPMAPVTVVVQASTTGDITLTGNVAFDAGNWHTPQHVAILAAAEWLVDGDVYVDISATATSDDATYDGVAATHQTIRVSDDDAASLVFTPPSSLVTTEAGGSTVFQAKLGARPASSVTVPVYVTDASEGTLQQTSLVFGPTNWWKNQPVTVVGKNDDYDDGNQSHWVKLGPTTSSDGNFDGMSHAGFQLTNTDNDTAGVQTYNWRKSPVIKIGEGGGLLIRFRLTSKPTGNVTVNFSTTGNQGVPDPYSLTIAPNDWAAWHDMYLRGLSEHIDDGEPTVYFTYKMVSSDGKYNSRTDTMPFQVQDNDTAGMNVVTNALTVSETGDTDTFTIKLTSQPIYDVKIPLASSAPSEFSVSPTVLTITKSQWSQPHTVTVKGLNDGVQDLDGAGYVQVKPAQSTDAKYNNMDGPDVPVTNLCKKQNWYPDTDNDGYYSKTAGAYTCIQPAGYASSGNDCKDSGTQGGVSAKDIHPGAAEVCFVGDLVAQGVDDDCDNVVDDGCPRVVGPNLGSSPWGSTWNHAPGYIVDGAELLTSSLTIKAGTTVYFTPGSKLTVDYNRSIHIQGTTANPVVFKPWVEGEAGRWNGLYIEDQAGASEVVGLHLEGSKYNGLQVNTPSKALTISDSAFTNNKKSGLYWSDSMSAATAPIVERNTFSNNGLDGLEMYQGKSRLLNVRQNTMSDNGRHGINCRVNGNGLWGYHCFNNIGSNTFTDNAGWGVQIPSMDAPSLKRWNTWTNNGSGGARLFGETSRGGTWQNLPVPWVILDLDGTSTLKVAYSTWVVEGGAELQFPGTEQLLSVYGKSATPATWNVDHTTYADPMYVTFDPDAATNPRLEYYYVGGTVNGLDIDGGTLEEASLGGSTISFSNVVVTP
jgi:hypothetical protein